ncbi:MAG TPA: efflux RND transporter periplasmic adaptor subunit [Gammaproteobacteria bacterium]|nr:efflux RND transporter periplasmic adaptor subunit [Gammaproteobacteria bacterium]
MRIVYRLVPALTVAFVLGGLGALLAGCTPGEAKNAAAAPQAPQVTTAEVAVRDLREWADFTGRLEAVGNVDVRARVGGYVESVNFAEGGRVERGDLLFQIDPRPFKAEVDRLNAERERANAERELARSYSDRAERLLARNATSREEYEQLAANASVADAKLAAVQAALEAAKLNLSFTRVTAPIAGRVSRAIVTAGNLVDSSTLLTTLVSDDPVYVYFDVDEQAFLEQVSARSAGGEPVEAYVGLINEEGYPHAARLDFVDNQVDADHGTIRARAVLDNADGQFTPGLFARLKLVSPRHYRAALVDDRAIGTDLGRKFVFVVDDQNVVQYRPIETGRVVAGLRVVKSGLDSGDVVVVNGLQRVRPGVTVAPTQVAMERDVPAASLARFTADGGADAELAGVSPAAGSYSAF